MWLNTVIHLNFSDVTSGLNFLLVFVNYLAPFSEMYDHEVSLLDSKLRSSGGDNAKVCVRTTVYRCVAKSWL